MKTSSNATPGRRKDWDTNGQPLAGFQTFQEVFCGIVSHWCPSTVSNKRPPMNRQKWVRYVGEANYRRHICETTKRRADPTVSPLDGDMPLVSAAMWISWTPGISGAQCLTESGCWGCRGADLMSQGQWSMTNRPSILQRLCLFRCPVSTSPLCD